MRGKFLFLVVGIISLLTAFYLAFFLSFNHFYEFLLIGLFFVIFPFTIKYFNDFKLFTVLYLSFVVLGLFIDLLIGLNLFELWYYSYSNLFEYLLLYTLVYPFGSFVMLGSFLLGKSFIKTNKKSYTGNLKIGLIIFTIILLALTAFLAVSGTLFTVGTWAVILAVSIVILGIISINAFSEFLNAKSYAREFLKSPGKVALVTLFATYINAFLHEYPNIFAGQWVYTAYINPFFSTSVLGIPLLVLLVWPILTIAPVSIYFFWKPIFVKNKF